MKHTILIVDDAADFRDTCALFLSHEGFDVAVACNGQEAVDKALHTQPDMILMDLSLPVMGGLEATKQIKKDPRTHQVPVILMTAHVRSGSKAVIEGGCDGFLVKPCAPEKIVDEIDRVLKRSSKEHDSMRRIHRQPKRSMDDERKR